MNAVETLLEARKHAGLPDLTLEQQLELVEKKLSGKEKEDFLAKMGKKGKTKKEPEVDDGNPGPSKGAKKAIDQATIKGSVSGEKGAKKKKKVSEHLNAVLTGAGLQALSEADAAKVDAQYPDEGDDE